MNLTTGPCPNIGGLALMATPMLLVVKTFVLYFLKCTVKRQINQFYCTGKHRKSFLKNNQLKQQRTTFDCQIWKESQFHLAKQFKAVLPNYGNIAPQLSGLGSNILHCGAFAFSIKFKLIDETFS